MYPQLKNDAAALPQLLEDLVAYAQEYLAGIDGLPVALQPPERPLADLPQRGGGAQTAWADFQTAIAPALSASAGPRYLGFVTGGVTPAALIGEWLTGLVDQNVTADYDSIAPHIEDEAIHMLRQLFGLPPTYHGAFVSGATLASFAGLAVGRQWLGAQRGVNLAQSGLSGFPPIHIIGGTLHSSIFKALAMLGIGRDNVHAVPLLPQREAVDLQALTHLVYSLHEEGHPLLVIGSAGTVNSVDFDDLAAIGRLRDAIPFWYHIDAAFGGFAAVSPTFSQLSAGLDSADSITIDAHKWLNVPYDSGMFFTRHPAHQTAVFQNSAAYLGEIGETPAYVHRTPQNSRRFRALATWFTLKAYGAEGHREIVERCCALARDLGEQIAKSEQFTLLAPVKLNVVCFTLNPTPSQPQVADFLQRLQAAGEVFLTPTSYLGQPAVRAAFSSWRTQPDDVARIWQSLQMAL